MAGTSWFRPVLSLRGATRGRGIRYCSQPEPESRNQRREKWRVSGEADDRAPRFIKLAVSGATELLRLLSLSPTQRQEEVGYQEMEMGEISVACVTDVIGILKSDYESAYFVTGIFTPSIYAEDCIFEDPTISFQGTKLYSRNLKLLVPFFDSPSIGLQNIEEGANYERNCVQATWKLRTYLKLPWRPFISVDGRTIYELDKDFKIVRHTESWNVTALEAICQIFTPSLGRTGAD